MSTVMAKQNNGSNQAARTSNTNAWWKDTCFIKAETVKKLNRLKKQVLADFPFRVNNNLIISAMLLTGEYDFNTVVACIREAFKTKVETNQEAPASVKLSRDSLDFCRNYQ